MGLIQNRDLILLEALIQVYDNPETFDDADLSNVTVDEQSYISIVDHFTYLGSFISRGVTDGRYIDARI